MKFVRDMYSTLPDKFEILTMESETLWSLYNQLRFDSKYEFSLMQAITQELLRRRNKNENERCNTNNES